VRTSDQDYRDAARADGYDWIVFPGENGINLELHFSCSCCSRRDAYAMPRYKVAAVLFLSRDSTRIRIDLDRHRRVNVSALATPSRDAIRDCSDCTVSLAICSSRFPHSTDVIPRRISFHEDGHADETRLFLRFSSSARDAILTTKSAREARGWRNRDEYYVTGTFFYFYSSARLRFVPTSRQSVKPCLGGIKTNFRLFFISVFISERVPRLVKLIRSN